MNPTAPLDISDFHLIQRPAPTPITIVPKSEAEIFEEIMNKREVVNTIELADIDYLKHCYIGEFLKETVMPLMPLQSFINLLVERIREHREQETHFTKFYRAICPYYLPLTRRVSFEKCWSDPTVQRLIADYIQEQDTTKKRDLIFKLEKRSTLTLEYFLQGLINKIFLEQNIDLVGIFYELTQRASWTYKNETLLSGRASEALQFGLQAAFHSFGFEYSTREKPILEKTHYYELLLIINFYLFGIVDPLMIRNVFVYMDIARVRQNYELGMQCQKWLESYQNPNLLPTSIRSSFNKVWIDSRTRWHIEKYRCGDTCLQKINALNSLKKHLSIFMPWETFIQGLLNKIFIEQDLELLEVFFKLMKFHDVRVNFPALNLGEGSAAINFGLRAAFFRKDPECPLKDQELQLEKEDRHILLRLINYHLFGIEEPFSEENIFFYIEVAKKDRNRELELQCYSWLKYMQLLPTLANDNLTSLPLAQSKA